MDRCGVFGLCDREIRAATEQVLAVSDEQEDPGGLADELEQQARKLERRSEDLGEDVQDVRQDWERKRADQGVPGANPPEQDQASGQGNDVPPERKAGEAHAD